MKSPWGLLQEDERVTCSLQGPPDGVCIPGVGAHSAWVTSLHLGPGQGEARGCGCRKAGRNVSRRGKVELMHFAGRTSENRAFSGETIATRLRSCKVREGPGPREVARGGGVSISPRASPHPQEEVKEPRTPAPGKGCSWPPPAFSPLPSSCDPRGLHEWVLNFRLGRLKG